MEKMKSNTLIYVGSIFTLLYLLFEAAFNIKLLEVSGSISTMQEINNIEFYGRLLSSVGMSIILFKILTKLNVKKAILMACLCVPVFFYAQKTIIDHVAKSQDRDYMVSAMYIHNLKGALIEGYVDLDGLGPQGRVFNEGADDKTFLTALGPILLGNNRIIDYVDNNLNSMLFQIAEHQVRIELPLMYNELYIPLNDEIHDLYDLYQTINGGSGNAEIAETVDRLWNNYMQLNRDLLPKINEFKRVINQNRTFLQRAYRQGIGGVAHARNSSVTQNLTAHNMISRANRSFANSLNQGLAKGNFPYRMSETYLNLGRECQEVDTPSGQRNRLVSNITNGNRRPNTKAVHSGTGSGGKSVVCQYDVTDASLNRRIDRDFGSMLSNEINVTDAMSVTNLNQIVNNKQSPDRAGHFLQEAGFFDINSRIDFVNYLKDNNWDGSKSLFAAAVARHIMSNSEEFDIPEFVKELPVGLSFERFVTQESIQDKIKEVFVDNNLVHFYDAFDSLLMGQQAQYFDINKIAKHKTDTAYNEVREFQQSVLFEQEIKPEYIKAVWIPFVALVLSLFMFFVNLVLIVNMGLHKFIKVPYLVPVISITVLIIVPILIGTSYHQYDAFNLLMEDTKDTHLLTYYMVRWVMALQPYIVPFGEPLTVIFDYLPSPPAFLTD